VIKITFTFSAAKIIRTATLPSFRGGTGFVRPNVGDYDGDGKGDFCIHNQAGQFLLLRSTDLEVEYINPGHRLE